MTLSFSTILCDGNEKDIQQIIFFATRFLLIDAAIFRVDRRIIQGPRMCVLYFEGGIDAPPGPAPPTQHTLAIIRFILLSGRVVVTKPLQP